MQIDAFTLVLVTLLLAGAYVLFHALRYRYIDRQYQRYKLWVTEAAEIPRIVNFGTRALTRYEIRDEIMLARNSEAYIRPIWLSFLDQDIDVLIENGFIKKEYIVMEEAGGRTYDDEVYCLTSLGTAQYQRFHLHPTSNFDRK